MRCIACIAASLCIFGLFVPQAEARMMRTSYYDSASPEIAASLEYPFGTILQLTNPRNGRTTTVRIHDRGPFVRERTLDISHAKAKELGFLNAGVIDLRVDILRMGTERRHRPRH